MFASASPDNIKQWTCPDGKFVQNLTGHNAIVNCMAVNSDGVLMSGANNGSMYAWDWRTGYNFQRMQVCNLLCKFMVMLIVLIDYFFIKYMLFNKGSCTTWING